MTISILVRTEAQVHKQYETQDIITEVIDKISSLQSNYVEISDKETTNNKPKDGDWYYKDPLINRLGIVVDDET